MALFHFSAKIIRRSNGQSAVAAAAYRSGEKITSDFDGHTSDYRRKRFVDESVILLPANAPKEYADRSVLWNAVEAVEKQANAQLAREIEFALPIELSPEERVELALEFVQEQFVDKGMIADVCFHKQHRKRAAAVHLDANPHCHALLTLRPIDETGAWEPKNATKYWITKDGVEKLASPDEIKNSPGWEKLYSYSDASGSKHWLTKSFVEEHPDARYVLVNKFPKRETIQNPTMAMWNSPEMLVKWREAWANKLNAYFETHRIDAHVDHRSYADQGLDIIPTVHEGKSVTAMERRYKEEYEAGIARGENATPRHTEVRELNLAIKEHNEEIKMVAEIKKLQEKLRCIVDRAVERVEEFGRSFAETLERIRAEIVVLTVRIREAVDTKARVDEKISMNSAFLADVSSGRDDHLEELQAEANELESVLITSAENARQDLRGRLEYLQNAISLLLENRSYAAAAEEENAKLSAYSEDVGEKIDEMKSRREELRAEYSDKNGAVPEDSRRGVEAERADIRPGIEAEYSVEDPATFRSVAKKIDEELGCDFGQSLSVEGRTVAMKIS